MNTFRQALHHVAKSGEVWCEGARIFLNPTSSSFNIKNARIALNYAVFFTPQYGDSYIEVSTISLSDNDIEFTINYDIFVYFPSIS